MSKHKGSEQRGKGAEQRQQPPGQNRDATRQQDAGAHDRSGQHGQHGQQGQHGQHGHEPTRQRSDERGS